MTNYLIKKFVLYVLGAFVLLNIIVFGSFYTIFVIDAPKQYKDARTYLVAAHVISFYELFTIKNNILSYTNSILTPIRKAKKYFYEKGINKLPKYEVERAIWFGLIEFLPIYKDLENKGSLTAYNFYDKKTIDYLIQKSYENMKLISFNEFLDFDNKRLMERVVPLFLKYHQILNQNFNIPRDGLNNVDSLLENIKDKTRVNKLKEAYLAKINFSKNKYYKEKFENDLKSIENVNQFYSELIIVGAILENLLIENDDKIPKTKEYKLIHQYFINLNKKIEKFKETTNPENIKYLDLTKIIGKSIFPTLYKEKIYKEEELYKFEKIKKAIFTLRSKKGYKVLAAAFDKDNRYAFAYTFGYKDKELGEKIALERCTKSVEKFNVKEKCQLYKFKNEKKH